MGVASKKEQVQNKIVGGVKGKWKLLMKLLLLLMKMPLIENELKV